MTRAAGKARRSATCGARSSLGGPYRAARAGFMSETPGDVSGARRMSSGNFPERQGSTLGARALLESNAQIRRGSHLSAATPQTQLPFGSPAASRAIAPAHGSPMCAFELGRDPVPPGRHTAGMASPMVFSPAARTSPSHIDLRVLKTSLTECHVPISSG